MAAEKNRYILVVEDHKPENYVQYKQLYSATFRNGVSYNCRLDSSGYFIFWTHCAKYTKSDEKHLFDE